MRRHQLRCLAAIALATPLMTACGVTAVTTPRAGQALPSCPAAPPKLAPPRSGTDTALPLIRRAVATAVICQYAALLPGGKAAATPLRRLVLRGAGASGLAAVLDEAGPLTRHASQCDRAAALLPFDQVIWFTYRHGKPGRAVVRFTTCQLAVVTAGGRSGTLTSPFQDDLFAYTLITGRDRGPAVPGVTGLSVAAAANLARRHHFGVSVDGQAIDAAVPFGTVIFQVLPPGARDGGPSPYTLGVFLAVRREPSCRPGQLRLDYRGGGPGAGSDFGAIAFRDVGRAPCQLAGEVRVTGVTSAGKAVTSTVSAPISAPGVLSPATARVRDTALPPLKSMLYVWPLIAEYRDDPVSPNGLCTTHWVIPAAWRVRLPGGSAVLVPNADIGNPSRLDPSGGLLTCRGRLGALGGPAFFG
jgi:hypothetical protein